MNTPSSNRGASPVRISIRESTQVARVKRVYAATPVRTSAVASNDRLYGAASGTSEVIDAWARRAALASGFGDAPVTGTSVERFSSHELALAARAAAHAGIGEILAALAQGFASQMRSVIASWKRARDARATRRALEQLDSRTLRDIGFERSEVASVAAELTGGAPVTRIRTLMTLHHLSI